MEIFSWEEFWEVEKRFSHVVGASYMLKQGFQKGVMEAVRCHMNKNSDYYYHGGNDNKRDLCLLSMLFHLEAPQELDEESMATHSSIVA